MSGLPPRQPRSRRASSSASPRRKSGKKKSSGPPIAIIGVVAAVVLIVVGGILYQTVIGPRLAGGGGDGGGGILSLAGIGEDSSEAIVGDYLDAMNDFASVVDGVTDASSAQAAIPKLQEIEAELLEIQRRAILVEPISPKEFKELSKKFDPEVKQLLARFKQGAGRLDPLGLQQTEFAFVLEETVSEQRTTGGVIDRVHKTVPEPKDELEAIARDHALLLRERERILARIDSEAQIASAITELKSLAGKIEEVADRKRVLDRFQNSRMGILTAKWLEYRGYGVPTVSLIAHVEKQFGPQNELRSADYDVSEADSKYAFAGGPGDTVASRPIPNGQEPDNLSADRGRRPPESRVADPSFSRGPGGLPGRPGGAFGGRQGRPFQPGTSPFPLEESVTIILEGGPFINPRELGLKGEEFFARSKQRQEAQLKFRERLSTLTGSTSSHSNITGNTAENFLNYTGDIQELADKIDFGKVTKVDKESRTITVDMSDVE